MPSSDVERRPAERAHHDADQERNDDELQHHPKRAIAEKPSNCRHRHSFIYHAAEIRIAGHSFKRRAIWSSRLRRNPRFTMAAELGDRHDSLTCRGGDIIGWTVQRMRWGGLRSLRLSLCDLRSIPARRPLAVGGGTAQHGGRGGRGDPCVLEPARRFQDSFVTLSFSFKRDGTLIGPPRPSGISVAGDADAKKAIRGRGDRRGHTVRSAGICACPGSGHGRAGVHMQFASQEKQSITPAN